MYIRTLTPYHHNMSPMTMSMTPTTMFHSNMKPLSRKTRKHKPQIMMKTYSMSSSMKNGELEHIREKGIRVNSNENMYSYMTNEDGDVRIEKGKFTDLEKKLQQPENLLDIGSLENMIVRKHSMKKSKKSKTQRKRKTKSTKSKKSKKSTKSKTQKNK